jgi:hypothetical protein
MHVHDKSQPEFNKGYLSRLVMNLISVDSQLEIPIDSSS